MESTYGKQMFCVGAYCKRKENSGVAWAPMENAIKTQVLYGNLWKRKENTGCAWRPVKIKQRKHMCYVETDGKRKENTGVAWEHMENTTKTQVLRGNQLKTQGKHMFRVGTYGYIFVYITAGHFGCPVT